MKTARKMTALVLALCVLCGLPFSIQAAGTGITFESAGVVQLTETTVTVELKFSNKIWLNSTWMYMGNTHLNGGCAHVSGTYWQITKPTLIPGADQVKSNNKYYASSWTAIFTKCTCHTDVWGADGLTVPTECEIWISQNGAENHAKGDCPGTVSTQAALGLNNEKLHSDQHFNTWDFSYESVMDIRSDIITFDDADVVRITDTTVTIRLKFSDKIWINDKKLFAGSPHRNGGCKHASGTHWQMGNPVLTAGSDQETTSGKTYSSVWMATFTKCDHDTTVHQAPWGADGQTVLPEAEIWIQDAGAGRCDGFIENTSAAGLNSKRLLGYDPQTGYADYSYLYLSDNRDDYVALDRATLVENGLTQVKVELEFSNLVWLDHNSVFLGSASDSVACNNDPKNWLYSAVSLEVTGETQTVGDRVYATTYEVVFNKCNDMHNGAPLWGEDGRDVPDSIGIIIKNDAIDTSNDDKIASGIAVSITNATLDATHYLNGCSVFYRSVNVIPFEMTSARVTGITATQVSVQMDFSDYIWLNEKAVFLTGIPFTAPCPIEGAPQHWQYSVVDLLPVGDTVLDNGREYAKTYIAVFDKCSDLHGDKLLWGDDGKTLPNPAGINIKFPTLDFTQDGKIAAEIATGIYGDRLAATDYVGGASKYEVLFRDIEMTTMDSAGIQDVSIDTKNTLTVTLNNVQSKVSGVVADIYLKAANGNIQDSASVILTDSGDGITWTGKLMEHGFYRNFIQLWQMAQQNGWTIHLSLFGSSEEINSADFGFDADAFLDIDKVDVLDQTRLVVTFSEAVEITKVTASIRLVNDAYVTKKNAENREFFWPGEISYYNDDMTQLLFVMKDPYLQANAKNAVIMDGLSELFEAGYETDGWRLMLAFTDPIDEKVRIEDGVVDGIVSVFGKYLTVNPMVGSLDAVYLDIDKVAIPKGKLTMKEITIVSDLEAIITFSAPVDIQNITYFFIRMIDSNNKMLWRTESGEYVVTNKDADGNPATPMQWNCKWEWYGKDHSQVKLTVGSGLDGLANFSDFLSTDWDAMVEGARPMIGIEESGSLRVPNNGRVDNVTLLSDSKITLTGTKFDAATDEAYLEGKVVFTPAKVTASATIINEMQIRVTFSHPMQHSDVTSYAYMSLIILDDDGLSILYGDDYNQLRPRFGGTWEWENNSHTSIIWTMNGKGNFGACNIYDVVNYEGALSIFKGKRIALSIQESGSGDFRIQTRNGRTDNFVTLDGQNHLQSTIFDLSHDMVYASINASSLQGQPQLELLSVTAVDDQTIELKFSEAVRLETGDKAPTLVVRYVNATGKGMVLADGKTANFKGNISVKENDPSVLVWKLNSKNADNLSDIFNFNGNLKWNNDGRVVMVIENTAEGLPTYTMRMWGISSLDGKRMLAIDYMQDPQLLMDVDIAYDLPPAESAANQGEEPIIEYYSNYLAYVLIAAAIFLVGMVILVVTIAKCKKGEK